MGTELFAHVHTMGIGEVTRAMKLGESYNNIIVGHRQISTVQCSAKILQTQELFWHYITNERAHAFIFWCTIRNV